MPRPKVLPENRVRGYRACNPCKISKIRCDSQLPCVNCTKKSRVACCTYNASSSSAALPAKRTARSRERQHATISLPPDPETELLSPAITAAEAGGRQATIVETAAGQEHVSQPSLPETAMSVPSVSSPSRPGLVSENGSTETTNVAIEEEDSPQEHFVTGPNGETLYIGENASLSFLDFLRHSLKQLVGATAFTDAQPQSLNLMLESDMDQVPESDMNLSIQEKNALFSSYSAVSSGILRLFSNEEAQSLLEDDLQSPKSGSRRDDVAAMETALAIGAQARASGPIDSQCASTLFVRSRAVAFENMLSNPSVSVVRLFVLLSFYTLGAFRQIPASIYLGIASKAAVVLGLHQPMSPKALRQGVDYTSRLRIWHSLCILDVLASSLLGRPCTVPRATRHKIQSLPLDPTQPAFNAILKAAVIVDDVCCVLNREKILDAPVAQDLLTRLRGWSRDLPSGLKKFTCEDASSMSQSDEHTLIGNVHVSSVYYFAIVLVTRPFLIRTLMPTIRRRIGLTTQNCPDPVEVVLAQVCITAAVHMGQLCGELTSMVGVDGRPLNTLSLFKAWAFGSGLILGLSMLAGEPRHDVNEAFNGVIQLLGMTEESKPQSQLYNETLRAFKDTIGLYQRMACLSSSRSTDPFVQQILTIDTGEKTTSPPLAVESENPIPSTWDGGFSFCGVYHGDNLSGSMAQVNMPELPLQYHDWNDFSVPFSGDFGLNFGNGLL